MNWKDGVPLYRQLQDRVIAQVLDRTLVEGTAVASVRQCAAEHQVNPLTVSRAYQGLADRGVLEKRRGVGWFVRPGSLAALRAHERADFMAHQWPAVLARAQRLGVSIAELLAGPREPVSAPESQNRPTAGSGIKRSEESCRSGFLSEREKEEPAGASTRTAYALGSEPVKPAG